MATIELSLEVGNLGEWIKRHRNACGLTQDGLMQAMGKTGDGTIISDYERNVVTPSLGTLGELVWVFTEQLGRNPDEMWAEIGRLKGRYTNFPGMEGVIPMSPDQGNSGKVGKGGTARSRTARFLGSRRVA